jgi:Xaa-Pro aminopeptidase
MNVLIYADSETSPEMRHELPLAIVDRFLYLEADGHRAVLTNQLEQSRIAAAAPDVEALLGEELGLDELVATGRSRTDIGYELCLRAATRLAISEAAVPPDFPLALADFLRAGGLTITPAEDLFVARRRSKSDAELAGIRSATKAALAAIAEAAAMLREATIVGDQLRRDGELLTSELVRERIREVCARAGAAATPDVLVVPVGPVLPGGHDSGSGPLPAHTPIVIDLWPRDEASGCWSDMTRTFVRGEISDAIAELHALVLEAHRRACAAIRPGLASSELYGVACDVFEAAGHPTARSKAAGETLREGFYFALGHGVGLEVHEAPTLSRIAGPPLVEGEVLAIEPGTSVSGLGGSRVEDLVLVTASGCENLTESFPYDLVP